MKPFPFIKQHKLTVIFLATTLALIAIAAGIRTKNQAASGSVPTIPTVSLLSVADFRQEKTVSLDNGAVESLGQADLKAQISAPVAQINTKLGDDVTAGQVLVQLQNTDVKAQLEQARAGLAAAQARLDELEQGSRAEDIAISQTAVAETKTSLANSIRDAYAKSDDSIHNHIDKFFVNPRQNSAEFMIQVNASGAGQASFKASDTQRAANVEQQKYAIEKILADWLGAADSLSASSDNESLETVLELSKGNLQEEIDFLNDMAPLVNSLSTDNAAQKGIIDGYKSEFAAARGTVSGSLAALQAAETSWQTAQKALDYKLAGASEQQILQGKAAVQQARASVDSLNAALAKTSVVSPIAGKVSYISGNVGEYVSSGTLVASVVNPTALRIKAYASENDLPYISPGNEVAVGNGGKGVVQTIAPALDTLTKKAEINIVITQNSPIPVVVGQNVNSKIYTKNSGAQNSYLLPIEAVQFTGNATYVFMADKNGQVEKISVTTGEIVGEKVYVTGGLDDNSRIISSTRGLEAGENVKISD